MFSLRRKWLTTYEPLKLKRNIVSGVLEIFQSRYFGLAEMSWLEDFKSLEKFLGKMFCYRSCARFTLICLAIREV